MLTVTLRSDAASLLLCTVDGPEQVAFDTVADMAWRAPVTSTVEFRDRLTGALTAASLRVNAYAALDIGAATIDFDRITVGDGDILTDFPLTALHQFTHDGALKAWETRDRGHKQHDPEEGFVEGHGVGPRTAAQANAERERIAKLLTEAKDPGPERARILADLDDNGDASTLAEFDRINGDQWTPERQALQESIIRGRLAAAQKVPRDGKAVLLGGLPGSGKSSVLKHDKVGIDKTQYLELDPDSIKQELIDKGGMDFTGRGELSDGEMAAWMHQESTHIVDVLHDLAVKQRINVIIDKTMSKSPSTELAKLHKAGYTVHGIFVDVSIPESLESVDSRWKDGGRFIPPTYIRKSAPPEGSKAMSVNALAFQTATTLPAGEGFDNWTYVTNKGIAIRKPHTVVRHGAGRFEFALDGLVVFRSSDTTARDYHGRWTGPGGDAARSAVAEADIVVDADNVTVKVGAGAAVDLVKNLGTRPTPSDLTKVHIAGFPGLFGRVARNTLRRVDMPQVPTDKLDAFAAYLHARGIRTSHELVSPLELKATQSELDGRKVGQMITAMQHGTMSTTDKPLWASADGYILDGHHRWAAEAVLAASGADRPLMPIVRVHAPMTQLIGQARAFNQVEGIDSKHHGMTLAPVAFTHEGAIKAWETRQRKKAEAAAPAAPPSGGGGVNNGLPTPAEFDSMEKTGGPLGSQGGGWYRDSNGQRYLVKPAQSRRHAMNELTEALLYKQAGTPVDETGIFERDGKWFIAKQAIQGVDGKLGKIVGDGMTPDLQREAQDGFGTDALASSWDAYGLTGDNVITSGGVLYRIDVGGSGMYRAMGGDKASFNPGQEWVEPATLRTSNQGHQLYGNMDDETAAHQLAKLKSFDITGFDAKLAAMGVDDDVRTRTVATIRDRIQNQLDPIIAKLDPTHPLIASAAWLDTACFTREGAIKAWESRDHGEGSDGSGLSAEQFGKLVPDRRTSTPAEWQSTAAEFAAAKRHAAAKARDVPKPTAEKVAKNRAMLDKIKTHGGRAGGEMRGNSTTRRERGEALFNEFGGGKKGYVPCSYCGIKVSPKGRGGHAVMQQDKILTAAEGGSYGTKNSFPNLIPACTGCNAHRNDRPMRIHPSWAKKGLAAAADPSRSDLVGSEVVAFPLGWDDPGVDTFDTPVQGILSYSTVETEWGEYEQWVCGGEVIDPTTVTGLPGA